MFAFDVKGIDIKEILFLIRLLRTHPPAKKRKLFFLAFKGPYGSGDKKETRFVVGRRFDRRRCIPTEEACCPQDGTQGIKSFDRTEKASSGKKLVLNPQIFGLDMKTDR